MNIHRPPKTVSDAADVVGVTVEVDVDVTLVVLGDVVGEWLVGDVEGSVRRAASIQLIVMQELIQCTFTQMLELTSIQILTRRAFSGWRSFGWLQDGISCKFLIMTCIFFCKSKHSRFVDT